jgi:hypothetical protein
LGAEAISTSAAAEEEKKQVRCQANDVCMYVWLNINWIENIYVRKYFDKHFIYIFIWYIKWIWTEK